MGTHGKSNQVCDFCNKGQEEASALKCAPSKVAKQSRKNIRQNTKQLNPKLFFHNRKFLIKIKDQSAYVEQLNALHKTSLL